MLKENLFFFSSGYYICVSIKNRGLFFPHFFWKTFFHLIHSMCYFSTFFLKNFFHLIHTMCYFSTFFLKNFFFFILFTPCVIFPVLQFLFFDNFNHNHAKQRELNFPWEELNPGFKKQKTKYCSTEDTDLDHYATISGGNESLKFQSNQRFYQNILL